MHSAADATLYPRMFTGRNRDAMNTLLQCVQEPGGRILVHATSRGFDSSLTVAMPSRCKAPDRYFIVGRESLITKQNHYYLKNGPIFVLELYDMPDILYIKVNCVICWNNKSQVLSFPCGHLVTCANCANATRDMEGAMYCALCRTPIVHKRVYVCLMSRMNPRRALLQITSDTTFDQSVRRAEIRKGRKTSRGLIIVSAALFIF